MSTLDYHAESIADTYARTLAELSEAAGNSDEILSELEAVAGMIEQDETLADFMMNPALDPEVRRKVLEHAFRGKIDDLLLNTLLVMNRKGRAGLVPLLSHGYRDRLDEIRKIVDVMVTSAVPLSESMRSALQETARKLTGHQVRLIERVDPSILGGLVVRVGDEKHDASVARRLVDVHESLIHKVAGEMMAGRKFFELAPG